MANILVIDDEKLIRAILREILEGAGHTVSEAADGKAALRRFAGNRTDVVISDIYMPEMDRIEFLIRVREAFPEARIIALSGGGLIGKEEVLRYAVRLGAVGVLKKPFSPEECLEAIRLALETDDEGAADRAEGA